MGTERRESPPFAVDRTGLPGRSRPACDVGTPLPEDAGGDRVGIRHRQGPRQPVLPHRRNQVQKVLPGLEHPEGSPSRPQDVAHLPQDDPGRVVQPKEGSQGLADGVEEVDLLVPLAQLVGEEADLLGELEGPTQEVGHQVSQGLLPPLGSPQNLHLQGRTLPRSQDPGCGHAPARRGAPKSRRHPGGHVDQQERPQAPSAQRMRKARERALSKSRRVC
jgi:hypothetical protein